jgi:hypothetical protein
MSTVSFHLPDSLHERIKELARKDGISVDQFLATAAAEKMASLMTVDYLEERAKRGSRGKFRKILDRVPDVPPDPGDELDF